MCVTIEITFKLKKIVIDITKKKFKHNPHSLIRKICPISIRQSKFNSIILNTNVEHKASNILKCMNESSPHKSQHILGLLSGKETILIKGSILFDFILTLTILYYTSSSKVTKIWLVPTK